MKVIFHGAGNDSKYRDVAPSTYIETSARKLFWAIKTECPKTWNSQNSQINECEERSPKIVFKCLNDKTTKFYVELLKYINY